MSPYGVTSPYPEPVYTDWSSVHCNAIGVPLVDQEHHGKNVVETVPHWNTTGKTMTILAYTGTTLERVAPMPVWNNKMAGQ